jgi:hypothetical protein
MSAWLTDLYVAPYDEANHLHAAMMRVYMEFDLLFHTGDFGAVDSILECVRVQDLPPVVTVSFLAASFPARDKLTQRQAYAARVKEAFPLPFHADLHGAIDALLK